MKPHLLTIAVSLTALTIFTANAQRIEPYSIDPVFLSTAGTPSVGSESGLNATFTITETTPFTTTFSFQIVTPSRPQALTPPEATTQGIISFYLRNQTTSAETNLVSTVYSLGYNPAASVYGTNTITLSASAPSLTPGTYELRHRRGGDPANGAGLNIQLASVRLGGSGFSVLAQSISPAVQAALNSAIAAQQAGDAALAAQIATLANDLATTETTVTTLQAQIAALQASQTTQDGQIAALQTDLATAQNSILSLNNQVTEHTNRITTLESANHLATADIQALQQQLAQAQATQAAINSDLYRQRQRLRDRIASNETMTSVTMGIGAAGLATGAFAAFEGLGGFGPNPTNVPSSARPGTSNNPTTGTINRTELYRRGR